MESNGFRILGVAPVFLVRDMAAALGWWKERLGFSAATWGAPVHFAIVERDGIRAMLALSPSGETPAPNWRVADKTNQAYFWVNDAAALYAEVRNRGAEIDFTLYDTPWGTREFGVQDPNGYDIAFGEVLQ